MSGGKYTWEPGYSRWDYGIKYSYETKVENAENIKTLDGKIEKIDKEIKNIKNSVVVKVDKEKTKLKECNLELVSARRYQSSCQKKYMNLLLILPKKDGYWGRINKKLKIYKRENLN